MNQDTFWRFAVASLDYNPLHTDPDWVKTAQPFKVPYTVAHGMMTMSFMTSVVTDWAYTSGLKITNLATKLPAQVRPGCGYQAPGMVTEKHVICKGKNFVVIETKAVNQGREDGCFRKSESSLPGLIGKAKNI